MYKRKHEVLSKNKKLSPKEEAQKREAEKNMLKEKKQSDSNKEKDVKRRASELARNARKHLKKKDASPKYDRSGQ